MAMGQASKLFEQQSSQGNVANGESKESAVQYVLFPIYIDTSSTSYKVLLFSTTHHFSTLQYTAAQL